MSGWLVQVLAPAIVFERDTSALITHNQAGSLAPKQPTPTSRSWTHLESERAISNIQLVPHAVGQFLDGSQGKVTRAKIC